jgi:hypothetical protein
VYVVLRLPFQFERFLLSFFSSIAVEAVNLLVAANGAWTIVLLFPSWFDGRNYSYDSSIPIFHDVPQHWSIAIARGIPRGYVFPPRLNVVYLFMSPDLGAAIAAVLGKPCYNFGAPRPNAFCDNTYGLVRYPNGQLVPMLNTSVRINSIHVSEFLDANL